MGFMRVVAVLEKLLGAAAMWLRAALISVPVPVCVAKPGPRGQSRR
jgi:hypothetical protein